MGFCLILSLTILPLPSASHPSHVDLIKKYRWTFALSRPSSHHNFIHQSPTANSLYQHPATMISQRVVVLSALVALFALLSAADGQQLRANNKRVLIEQEIEEDATFWGRELGGSSKSGKSSKGSGKGKGGSKSSKGSGSGKGSGKGGSGKGGSGKGGSGKGGSGKGGKGKGGKGKGGSSMKKSYSS